MKFEEQAKVSGFIDLINESVHTSDDVDIGDIYAVNRDLIVVKRGYVNVHFYYIPIHKVEGWDGFVLWLKITEDEVKRAFERDVFPDPYRYYVKGYSLYTTSYFPVLPVIQSRYMVPTIETKEARDESIKIYQCDLCNTWFNTEEELSNHVSQEHV